MVKSHGAGKGRTKLTDGDFASAKPSCHKGLQADQLWSSLLVEWASLLFILLVPCCCFCAKPQPGGIRCKVALREVIQLGTTKQSGMFLEFFSAPFHKGGACQEFVFWGHRRSRKQRESNNSSGAAAWSGDHRKAMLSAAGRWTEVMHYAGGHSSSNDGGEQRGEHNGTLSLPVK